MTTEPRSIPELLKLRVGAAAEKTFIFSEADGRRFSYGEFQEAVRRTAAMLVAKG